ncbi:hypothetical protein DUNSADRAFT_12951, partial [Dunaliella salina]
VNWLTQLIPDPKNADMYLLMCMHMHTCVHRVWCHFGQRYEAPDFMRNTLGRGKDGISVRGAMDAHFSYVILRRGPRPKAAEPSHPLSDQRHVQSVAQDQPISEEELWHEILLERMRTQEKPPSGLPKVPQGLEEHKQAQAVAHDRDGIFEGSLAATSLSTRVDALGQHLAKVESGEDGPWGEGNPAAATEGAEGAAAAAAAQVSGAHARPRRPLFSGVDADSFTGTDAGHEPSEEQRQPQVEQTSHRDFEGEEHIFRDSRHGNKGGVYADASSSSSSSSTGSISGGGSGSSDFDLGFRNGDSTFDRVLSDEHPQGTLDPGAHAEAFERKYPAHGRGLVDRLMALEDAGISWASNREGGLDADAVEAAMASIPQEELHVGGTGTHHASDGDAPPSVSMYAHEVEDHASLSSHIGEELGADTVKQHQVQAHARSAALHDALPDEVERAMHRLHQRKGGDNPLRSARTAGGMLGSDYRARAAAPWPRIYREPMKRGGHVILDLCMPLEEERSATQGECLEERRKQAGADAGAGAPKVDVTAGALHGRLSRQVVTKANAGRVLDKEAYRLSKEVSWGDLWPSFYIIK